MINEEGFKRRLLIEYKQLVTRLCILERALDGDKINDKQQKDLMNKQYEHMSMYAEILFERIITLMK